MTNEKVSPKVADAKSDTVTDDANAALVKRVGELEKRVDKLAAAGKNSTKDTRSARVFV